MFKKNACIFGGNTDLGKHIIKKLKKRNLVNRWSTFNVDYEANLDATENFILEQKLSLKEQLEKIYAQAKGKVEEFDAIVVAKSEGDEITGSISDEDIFDKYEKLWEQNVYFSMMAAKFAGNLLAPCGIAVFYSSLEAFEKTNPNNLPTNLSRMEVCSIALNIAELNEMPKNCIVTTILPSIMDGEKSRKLNPGTDHSTFDDPSQVADMIKQWCIGESRPENKTFTSFNKVDKQLTYAKFV